MVTFLNDIISINTAIINEYKTANFFKHPFKKIWLNKERSKIIKLVDTITNNKSSVPISVIIEYASILADNFKPFGQYGYCKRAMRCGKSALIIFEVNFDDDKTIIISVNPSDINGLKADINYSYLANHKAVMSFTDNDVEFINIDDWSLLDYFNFDEFNKNKDQYGDAIRNNACKYIIDDITEYMKSVIYKEV